MTDSEFEAWDNGHAMAYSSPYLRVRAAWIAGRAQGRMDEAMASLGHAAALCPTCKGILTTDKRSPLYRPYSERTSDGAKWHAGCTEPPRGK